MWWLVFLLATAAGAPEPPGLLSVCGSSTGVAWKEVKNHEKQLAFIAAANKAGSFAEEAPSDCGLRVTVKCGSDLDGDGVRDAVARAAWEMREPEGEDTPQLKEQRCHAAHFRGYSNPFSSTFLVLSAGGSSGAGCVLLLRDETGAGNEGATPVAFVRWRGRQAVRVVVEHMHSDTGVTDRTQRTLIVEHGELVSVAERRLSPTF